MGNEQQRVDVRRVIESCRDRQTDLLNADGRYLEWCLIEEGKFRAWGMTEAADECKAAAESCARNIKAASDSLRMAGRVPVTVFGRAPRRRRAALANVGAQS